MKFKQPVHISDCEPGVWYEETEQEIRGRGLSDIGGRAQVGFGVLDLGPGKNTRPAHYHTLEEEHLYVIDGNVVLHLGHDKYLLRAGSYVCFPAGQELGHYLENTSAEMCKYLIVGQRISEDVVIYPDNSGDGMHSL